MSKLYVLVRGDLSRSQQAVQACHAVAEFMISENEICCSCGQCSPELRWNNQTIVLIKTRDREDLVRWYDEISKFTACYTGFREPDIGHELTAVAAWGENMSNLLKDLPLL